MIITKEEIHRANALKKKMIEVINNHFLPIPEDGKITFTFVTNNGGIRESKGTIEHKI